MHIRPATKVDVKAMAKLWMLAMGDVVFEFIATSDSNKATDFLEHFIVRPHNQYSFENCLVAVEDGRVVGAVNFYDGEGLDDLRKPIIDYVKAHFNPSFNPERETQAGEVYIDTIAVLPDMQGKGIGKRLLQFLIDQSVLKNRKTLGLLVDLKNPQAKKLYLNLGFKPVGVKTLVGFEMEHLQLIPS